MVLIDREDTIKEILNVYKYKFPNMSGIFDNFVTTIITNILFNIPIEHKTHYAKVIQHETVIHGHRQNEYLCCNCYKKVLDGDDYCSHCGSKLEWCII